MWLNAQYSAISAKLKAMHGTYLTMQDYEQLLTKHTVGDVCAYLKNNTGYRKVLRNVNDREIHRLDLEVHLQRELREEYKRMYNFMNLSQRKMLRFWFEREEIEFMKRGLRYIFNGEKRGIPNFQDTITPFFREHTKIDLEAMEKARGFAEFAEACKDTIYYDILKRATAVEADIFGVVMLLDSFYYQSLWASKEKYMSTEDARYFSEYVGRNIDMLNILWIYRSKKYFNIDSEMIYTYLIPVRYRLSEQDIIKMVEASDFEQVEEYAAKTAYAGLFQRVGDGFFIEESHTKMIYRISKKIYKVAPLSMAAVFAYFNLKQTEIRNLKTIIEGIRYSFNSDAIKEHLCI